MGRERWSVEVKWRIVELMLLPGTSVARVAQAEGVNANQVFLWRRAYRNGEILPADSTALLPAHAAPEPLFPGSPSGAIHIEFPGRAAISVECDADRALLGTLLESMCR